MKHNTFTNIIVWTGDIIGAMISLAVIAVVICAALIYAAIGMVHLLAFMIYG